MRSVVADNRAAIGGGVVGNAKLTDSTVTRNSATTDAGGLFVNTAILQRSTVADNSTGGSGGGVVANFGSITDSRIARNHAGSSGGGVYVPDSFESTLAITRSTISGNSSEGRAGGMELGNPDGTLTVVNSTISGNATKGSGGGLVLPTGTAKINNTTIARNLADADSSGDSGGGIFQSGAGVVKLSNSLLAENRTLAGVGPDCFGLFAAMTYDAFSDVDGNCLPTPPGSDIGVLVFAGTPLGDLLNNGGLTPTHALLNGNLAKNAGHPGTGPGVKCAQTDQRGKPRGGAAGRCDIGAFEVQP